MGIIVHRLSQMMRILCKKRDDTTPVYITIFGQLENRPRNNARLGSHSTVVWQTSRKRDI